MYISNNILQFFKNNIKRFIVEDTMVVLLLHYYDHTILYINKHK